MAIERDWRIRKLIRANLEADGMDVIEAVSVSHGLQILDGRLPDLILLDMDLDHGEAFRFLGALQAEAGDGKLPVVGISDEPVEHWLLEHPPMVGCLRKPFSATKLLDIVGRALDRAPIRERTPSRKGDDSIQSDPGKETIQ